eukprot:CAMPEP_0175439498 /NCGR_PEP_ID=MMETSP0095-20121207/56574_1 /TAXON_ID=311494 /ORGANISM="Alexandrium monilatum, Strain CCMP3105" /LENGTH=238 /DNA_ID=CAMNT_0016739319 /DNA_START=42 /DNA_END=754 /DNA_ORIENTATION=+
MASPTSVAPLFSDLRGVTVRNTFLEFEDAGTDSFPESGFTRQASEPAKPFNRQVSEQTTSGSGATLEESATEADEGYSQLASYLSSAFPQVVAGDRRGGRARASTSDISGATLQAAFQAAAANSSMAPMVTQAPQGQLAVMRFCPNCGAEAEPNHRFCPYCCYPLQTCTGNSAGGGATGAGLAAQPGLLPTGKEGAMTSPAAPNLLTCLRRFRYVEASAADVELARVLCLNYMQGGKA